MKLAIIAALATLALAGCDTAPVKVAAAGAKTAVDLYCDTPQTARLALREAVAEAVKPNSIAVTCAADQAAPEAAP